MASTSADTPGTSGCLPGVAITGCGVMCSVAQSVAAFSEALREGRSGLRPMARHSKHAPSVGAPVQEFDWRFELEQHAPDVWLRARKLLNNAPRSTRLGVMAAVQAFRDAGLEASNAEAGERTGLIVAGNNLSQDYINDNMRRVGAGRAINPKYAISYSDSNQVGCCSEILGICGPGITVGAASASGNAALFQAWHWVRSGLVDRCVVVGASCGFSATELEGFAILGAASQAEDPTRACRPFDAGHSGFVWGEGAAAVVLESDAAWQVRGSRARGRVLGASLLLDARHGPEPSAAAEARAMRAALSSAGLAASAVDYVNAHGTGSPAGDRAECDALKEVFQQHRARVRINSTKALVGHCMSSAGIIELLACLLQMDAGFVHGNINLEQPIDDHLNFVGQRAEPAESRIALSNGFGFGGFNTSVVIARASES